MQGRSQERANQQQRRERAAEVIGTAFQLHLDTAPTLLKRKTDQGQFTQAATDLRQRHDMLRAQLWMLAAWYPSEKVRELAIELVDVLLTCLMATVGYGSGIEIPPGYVPGVAIPPGGISFDQEQAAQAYKEAEVILGKLIAAVRYG